MLEKLPCERLSTEEDSEYLQILITLFLIRTVCNCLKIELDEVAFVFSNAVGKQLGINPPGVAVG